MREKDSASADSGVLSTTDAQPKTVLSGVPLAPAHASELPATASLAQGSYSQGTLTVEQVYFEHIVENAPEAVSIVDDKNRILRINSEFTRLFGFSASDAVGLPIDQLVVPPDRYAETTWITETVKGGKKLALETRRQRKDGSLVEVLLSTSPVMLNGKRIGAYASYRDITGTEASRRIERRALRDRRTQPVGRGSSAVL